MDLWKNSWVQEVNEIVEPTPPKSSTLAAPKDWKAWIKALFPKHFTKAFAPHHVEYWEWLWSIVSGVMPRPFIGIWARGGGKTTNAEVGVVLLGCSGVKKYCWYIRETQDQADKSVENIAALLESDEIMAYYPAMGERAIGKFGKPRGWRRSRLVTDGGLTVDALGLDTAARGVKFEEQRPDLIVFDDIDGEADTEVTTEKKIANLTKKILPAGSTDVAIVGIQNLIIPNGVFSRLSNGSADFLRRAIISGPHPACHGLEYEQVEIEGEERLEYRVTAGEALWAGQDMNVIEDQINLWGLRAFLKEAQHEVDIPEGALWNRSQIDDHRRTEHPDFLRVGVGVDPHATVGETGIITVGIAEIKRVIHGWVLADDTIGGKPDQWGLAVVAAYNRHLADIIIGEINNGGDMIENVIRNVKGGANVNYDTVRATRGKMLRAEPVEVLYDEGRMHHMGYFHELESQMCLYVPGDASPNNLDALVWIVTKLVLEYKAKSTGAKSSPY
ncbi:MAG: DNA-packaging protein [Deltaproteobacteria bacterium]|nr:DNA-packaging protein [Deltaproteobacteria bacterium]